MDVEKKVDKIEVLQDGVIQVRTVTIVKEGAQEIARKYHRHVRLPDEDDLSGEDARVQAIASADWTPDRVESYRRKKANRAVRL